MSNVISRNANLVNDLSRELTQAMKTSSEGDLEPDGAIDECELVDIMTDHFDRVLPELKSDTSIEASEYVEHLSNSMENALNAFLSGADLKEAKNIVSLVRYQFDSIATAIEFEEDNIPNASIIKRCADAEDALGMPRGSIRFESMSDDDFVFSGTPEHRDRYDDIMSYFESIGFHRVYDSTPREGNDRSSFLIVVREG